MATKKKPEVSHLYSHEDSYKETIGCDYGAMILRMEDGTRVKLQIWSVSSGRRFDDSRKLFMKGSIGALILYYPKAYNTGTGDLALVQRLVTEFDDANIGDRPKVLLVVGNTSQSNLPPKSVNANPRLITDLTTDPPTELTKDERDGLAKLTASIVNARVVQGGSNNMDGVSLALTLLTKNMMEWMKSRGWDTSADKKSSMDKYDSLFKVTLIGDQQESIFSLLKT